MITLIKNTKSPDMALAMAQTMESAGQYSSREVSQMFIAASWARHEANINGVSGARSAINDFMDLTSKRISPNATGVPGAMAVFDPDAKARRLEIVNEINSQMVRGSDLDQELIAKFGKGVLEAFPGWSGVTDTVIAEIDVRRAEDEVARREEQAAMVFPDQFSQDQQERQERMFSGIMDIIQSTLGEEATPEQSLAMVSRSVRSLQDYINEFKQGIRPTEIAPDITILDLEAVQERLIMIIGGIG